MNIFYEICSKLTSYKDIKKCLLGGYVPCCVTGVSHIHKAQLAMTLSTLSTCLVICDDEASCTRMTEDINSMAQERIACVYPAKDLNFAYMEGISREYEHKRLEALSLILQGKCRVLCASMEACLQGTIPRSVLKENSFELKKGGEVQIEQLVKKLLAGGYTRTDQIEGQAQFSVRGSIVDIFPVQEQHPAPMFAFDPVMDLRTVHVFLHCSSMAAMCQIYRHFSRLISNFS